MFVSSILKDKKNIKSFEKQIISKDFFQNNEVKIYQRKNDKKGKFELGYIADYIEKYCENKPLLKKLILSYNKKGELAGIQNSQIRYLLIDYVKELQKEVDLNKKLNDELNERMKKLEDQNKLILDNYLTLQSNYNFLIKSLKDKKLL